MNAQQRIRAERQGLPIFSARARIIAEIESHDNIVIVGETGSGKSTQIPQYLFEEGLHEGYTIAITQPRRVAAISVAKRVAEEVGCTLGQQVGYSIRFEDVTSSHTKIKYMTDGMLLRETTLDPMLSAYSIIVLDEAHERSLHTDMLFSILKGIQTKRRKNEKPLSKSKKRSINTIRPLKVICMSATLEAKRFSEYFNAKVLYISGRLHPVQIMFTSEPQSDYIDSAIITVLQIHLFEPPGDILMFLTGQDEIEMCVKLLESKNSLIAPGEPRLLIHPLFAALHSEKQLKVFTPCPPGFRKVIVSTNIAETSITLPGIVYVVDSGVVKARQFHPKTGMDSLLVVPISKAEAWQRSGRAGRVAPGVCYRLYTEDAFDDLRPAVVPEIVRCNLASAVLQLKTLGVEDILSFDFMDMPQPGALVRALELLFALGALNDQGGLTKLGCRMAALPLDPLFSRVLVASYEADMACSREVLSLVSLLSLESGVFVTPTLKAEEAGHARACFMSPEGDHVTLLDIYHGFLKAAHQKQWCREHFISYRSLMKASQIRQQLTTMMGMDETSCGVKMDSVKRCLVTGFFLNTARRQSDGSYRTILEGLTAHIHPSSVLLGKKPSCVLFNALVMTNKQYMRDLSVIEQKWLPELVPAFFSSAAAESSRKLHIGTASQALSRLPKDDDE